MPQMNISQGMQIDQRLSAQTIITAQILQMNSLELEAAIQQELEINPLLEMDESSDSSDNETEETNDEYSSSDIEGGINWDDYFQDGFKYSRHTYTSAGKFLSLTWFSKYC